MSRPIPPTYKTRNLPSYNQALKRRGSLTIWFDPAMTWKAAPTGKRGRQRDYDDAAIQACLTMKVLFGMALRQTTGFVESVLRLIGLDWTVPDFSTLSRRQKTPKVNIPYRGWDGWSRTCGKRRNCPGRPWAFLASLLLWRALRICWRLERLMTEQPSNLRSAASGFQTANNGGGRTNEDIRAMVMGALGKADQSQAMRDRIAAAKAGTLSMQPGSADRAQEADAAASRKMTAPNANIRKRCLNPTFRPWS